MQKRWTDADIKVSHRNSEDFEMWCDERGIRYRYELDYVKDWRLVPPTPNANRIYHIWGKWPDRIMLCKLTWAGL